MDASQELQYFAKDFFTYEADFSLLLANTSQTTNFSIQADSDFLLAKLAYMATDTDDAVVPYTEPVMVSVLITDTGSGLQLSNIAVPVPNIFGSGQLPFIVPIQRLFVSNSVINVQVNNFSAVDYNALRLSFIGLKAFKRGR